MTTPPHPHAIGILVNTIATIGLSFALAACSAATSTSSESTRSALLGHWTHSFEEDADLDRAYRPHTFALPPARGREGYEFSADGSATYFAIGAADGVDPQPAQWTLSAENMLTISVIGEATPRRFWIAHVDDALLVLRDLE